jgi:hypothetical protein
VYWRHERRWNVPKAGAAGVMYDDTRPTQADEDELKRALGAQGKRWAAIFEGTVDGHISSPDPRWPHLGPAHRAWIAGRMERNRRKQDRVLDALDRWARKRAPRARRACKALAAASGHLRAVWEARRDRRLYGPPMSA